MALYIYTSDYNLKVLLKDVCSRRRFTDSGFDIPMLYQSIDTFNPFYTFNLGIKVASCDKDGTPTPCLLLPRSSISNSPFRMSNSIGLIDAGYSLENYTLVDQFPHTGHIEAIAKFVKK